MLGWLSRRMITDALSISSLLAIVGKNVDVGVDGQNDAITIAYALLAARDGGYTFPVTLSILFRKMPPPSRVDNK